jgi:hypothetical protein
MTEQARCRLCLIGLPRTGKTTYIAALWAYLTSGLPEGEHRVTEFPDDPSYLHEIAGAWAAGKTMPRNSLGASDRIEFTVETPRGSQLTIVLPDLPGEVFKNALVRPMIDQDTADAVVGSDLLLLFVNAETAKTYTALGDYGLPSENEGANGGSPSGGAISAQRQEFSIADLDTDTLNAELVHRLAYLCRDRAMPDLLVVVSAWDVAASADQTPVDWLSSEQPMLAQLVEELSRSTRVGVVGISAQGANYEDNPAVTEQLSGERPWGCDEDGTKTDIAGPLRWYDEQPARRNREAES